MITPADPVGPQNCLADTTGTVFQPLPKVQQCLLLDPLAAATGFELPARRALSLRTAGAGVLRVLRGRLWATRQAPTTSAPQAAPQAAPVAWLSDTDAACKGALAWPAPGLSGDIVLQAGQSLPLRAQDRLVVESLASPSSGPLLFSFEASASGGL